MDTFAASRNPWRGIMRGLSVAAMCAVAALTACTRDYTVAYVYATSLGTNSTGGNGVLNAYAVDYQTGALNRLSDSGITLGRRPTLTANPNGLDLYILNTQDSSIETFSIGTDGKVYLQQTLNTGLGVFPVAATVDPTGSFLYVIYTLTPPVGGAQSAAPPGELQVLPIMSNGQLGAPITNSTVGVSAGKTLNYFPVGNNPVGLAVSLAGNVYVIDQEPVGTGLITGGPIGNASGPTGILLTFAETLSKNTTSTGLAIPTGQLTPTVGTVITPVSTGGFTAAGTQAGSVPSAIAVSPNGKFAYVTDEAQNQLYAFFNTATGQPFPISSTVATTGQFPVAVTVDPRGDFIYVANFNESSVSPYAINQATGAPSAVAGGAFKVGTNPNCISIEPARGIYLYTSNFLDSTVSGLQLSANTGTLQNIQSTPFPAQPLPSCVVTVANGSHATQLVNP